MAALPWLYRSAAWPQTGVREQNKQAEPIKNHFTIFTLLAFNAGIKKIVPELQFSGVILQAT
jgi:hypothetical protein